MVHTYAHAHTHLQCRYILHKEANPWFPYTILPHHFLDNQSPKLPTGSSSVHSLLLYKLNLQEVVVRHVCQCHINTHTFRSLVGSNRFFLADFRQSIRQHLLPPNEDMSSWECVPVLITSCHYHSMLLLKSSQYLPETGWFPVLR